MGQKLCPYPDKNILVKKNYKVTLRPHPDTLRLNKKSIETLLNTFKKNKKVIYNPNVESVHNYFDNDVLISDWSGAAFEFAFGTLKPVIFSKKGM